MPIRKNNSNKKVVVIGGGTGTFTVLSGLKHLPNIELTAIVTMADDGGSTGVLRDEYGVLPPGDLRQCLVALSDEGMIMRKLFNHRFDRGTLKGHSFGNIFISTLEQITGDLAHALDVASKILHVKGRVLPVTFDKVALCAELHNGKILNGESEFMHYQLVSRYGIKKIALQPRARANPKALAAIREADMIIVGPGKLYTSILPNFLVAGVAKAFVASKAKKVYVANLMSQQGHTDNFTVEGYVDELEHYIGTSGVFDVVHYNNKKANPHLLKKYADEGEPVVCDHKRKVPYRLIGANLLADTLAKTQKKDMLRRTLIRHDAKKLSKAIISMLG